MVILQTFHDVNMQNAYLNTTASTVLHLLSIMQLFRRTSTNETHNFQDCTRNLVLAILHLSKPGPQTL